VTKQDKRKLKGIKTKELILHTTLEIMLEEGTKAITTRNIVKRSGIGKGSLYHHFDTIDDIIFEATMIMLNEYTKSIKDIKFTDLRDFIKKVGYSTIEMLIQHAEYGKNAVGLWEIILNNENYIERINQKNEEFPKSISSIIFKNINNKKISKKTIDELALSLYTSLMGMEIAIYMNPNEKLFKNMWDTNTKILMNYLLSNGE